MIQPALQYLGVSVLVVKALIMNSNPVAFAPLDVVAGNDSAIERSRIELVKSSQSWADLWAEHKLPDAFSPAGAPLRPDPPIVDFDKAVVLAVFGGQQRTVAGYRVVGTDGSGAHAIVRIAPIPVAGSIAMDSEPYLFLMLPKISKTIDVQYGVPGPDGSATWKIIATFAPKK